MAGSLKQMLVWSRKPDNLWMHSEGVWNYCQEISRKNRGMFSYKQMAFWERIICQMHNRGKWGWCDWKNLCFCSFFFFPFSGSIPTTAHSHWISVIRLVKDCTQESCKYTLIIDFYFWLSFFCNELYFSFFNIYLFN